MSSERPALNRLEVLRALRISNWEAVVATVHGTLTGGAFQTGFALWLGASNFWMGVLASIPTFAALVQLVSSYFIEKRTERKRFTAWFSVVARTLWLPILLIPFLLPEEIRFTAFVALLLLSSVLLNVPIPAFLSWLSDLVPPDHRGRYFARRNMLAGIVAMVVPLPAAWFLDLAVERRLFPESVGFATLFGVAVVCGIVGFVLLLKQAEPPMSRAEPTEAQGVRGVLAFYRAPFAEPNFRRLMVFSAVFALAQFFAAPFYTVYALQVLKLSYFWLQIFGALSSLSSLLSMPLWGYLSDKFGNKSLQKIGIVGVGVLPFMWVFTSPQYPVASLLILCINNLLGGFFWAGVGLTQFNLLIAISPSERRSVYVGAMSALTGVMGGVAPIAGGAILTALGDIRIEPLGWAMGGYQILFAMNGLMRYLSLLFLRGVTDLRDTSAIEVITQLGTARVGAWRQMRRLQHGQTETERREAAQALRDTRTALAVDELILALDDPSLHVREEAALALGEIGDTRAVEALIQRLDDPASGITDEAALSLGKIGDERAVEPLLRLFRTGEKMERVAAARALGQIGSRDAVGALVEAIEAGRIAESDEVRETAAGALGAIGDPSAVPALVRCLENSPRTLKLTAVRALGEIGDRRAAEPLLKMLAQEEDPALISHLAVALAMIGEERAVRPLLEAMDRVESPVARKQILNAVGALMGEGEMFYPLLALESYARDEAVSRLLQELARRERSRGQDRFGALRRQRQFEQVREQFVSGDFSAATVLLTRIASAGGLRSEDSAVSEVIEWASVTSQQRAVQPEEFLLALFAVRSLLSK